jgi:hypothetical protein
VVPVSLPWSFLEFYEQLNYVDSSVSCSSFFHLVSLIQDDCVFLSKGKKPQAPVKYQLTAYLFRHGATTGTRVGMNLQVLEGSIHNYCTHVVRAFRWLKGAYLRWPSDNEKQTIKTESQAMGFPGAIGSVDGTYIQMLNKPQENPMSY